MVVLWVAVIVLISPDGGLILTHNPSSFRSQEACVERLIDVVTQLGPDNLAAANCINVIPGEDV